jgi:hypothetical protein
MSLAHDTTNDNRFDDFVKNVRELGRSAGAGKDALPALAITVARASQDGVLDDTKDKHGKGVDDAAKVYEEYINSESKKSVLAHTAAGKAVNASKLRQVIRAGKHDSDFVETINRLIEAHRSAVAAEQKVKPTYNAIIDAARMQIDAAHKENSDALTDDEIREIISKPEKEGPTLEDILRKHATDLEKLVTGEHSSGIKCQDDKLVEAVHNLKDMLATFTNAAIFEENKRLHAQMAERGLDVTMEMVAMVAAQMRAAAAQ